MRIIWLVYWPRLKTKSRAGVHFVEQSHALFTLCQIWSSLPVRRYYMCKLLVFRSRLNLNTYFIDHMIHAI